jgi:hypothetical protein
VGLIVFPRPAKDQPLAIDSEGLLAWPYQAINSQRNLSVERREWQPERKTVLGALSGGLKSRFVYREKEKGCQNGVIKTASPRVLWGQIILTRLTERQSLTVRRPWDVWVCDLFMASIRPLLRLHAKAPTVSSL